MIDSSLTFSSFWHPPTQFNFIRLKMKKVGFAEVAKFVEVVVRYSLKGH